MVYGVGDGAEQRSGRVRVVVGQREVLEVVVVAHAKVVRDPPPVCLERGTRAVLVVANDSVCMIQKGSRRRASESCKERVARTRGAGTVARRLHRWCRRGCGCSGAWRTGEEMRRTLMLLCLITGTSAAEEIPKVTQLMSKDLTGVPGKEVVMLTVEYAPGESDPVVHRHDAHAFVYVLEGRVIMQVRGGQELTLEPGQTFYEGPDDVHRISRNASTTEPARFLVFIVKNKGAPILTPVK